MRIFVNNVDGYLAGAVCADLCRLSHHIIGTRKGRSDELIPPMVKRIVPRVEVRRLLKTVAACDVVIYDLHDADLEELEMVVGALQSSPISHDMVFILISSVGVWAHTQRSYEEVQLLSSPSVAADAAAAADGTVETAVPSEALAAGAGDDEAGMDGTATVLTAQICQRPVVLRSEDYTRRVPAPKFLEWKAIETQVLALRAKGTVRPYVVCSGIPYGNGEDFFMGLMKAAWQTKTTLRIIGSGQNFVPLVHVRDCARMVRHVLQVRPQLEYHLAVDRGDVSQRAMILAAADHYRLPYVPASISVAEALLAELADLMTIDLRLEPSPLTDDSNSFNILAKPVSNKPQPLGHSAKAAKDDASAGESQPDGKGQEVVKFRWWCEHGMVSNIAKVADEFRVWRRLDPVRICVIGPPGSGTAKVGAELAKRFSVAHVDLDDLIEEHRNMETPLGQQLRQELDAIAAALANPKAQGPFLLPSGILHQLVEVGMARPLQHRGFVLSGFPQTAEEASALFRDAATQKAKSELVLDKLVMLSSKDAACLARLQALERPLSEKEFQIRLDRWKKDNPEGAPGLSDFITGQVRCGRVDVDVDGQAPETGPVVSPEEAIERCLRAVAARIMAKRPLSNFLPPLPTQPPADIGSSKEKDKARKRVESVPTPPPIQEKDPAVRREEELKAQKQREEQQHIEQIRKDELIKLEKHSEPLRQYLMQFVVPALTSGLVEVCQELPKDPIGYLSEYLLVYSEAIRARHAFAALPPPASSTPSDSAPKLP